MITVSKLNGDYFRTSYDDRVKTQCNGNWPGFLMWNLTYEKRKTALLVYRNIYIICHF